MIARSAERDYRRSIVSVHFVQRTAGVMSGKKFISGIRVDYEAQFPGAQIDRYGHIISYVGGWSIYERDLRQMEASVEIRQGQSVPAQIIGVDHRIELVLLRSSKPGPTYLSLGDSIEAERLYFVFDDEGKSKLWAPESYSTRRRKALPEWEIQVPGGGFPNRFGGNYILNGEGQLVGIVTGVKERSPSRRTTTLRALPSTVLRGSLERIVAGDSLVAGWLGIQLGAETQTPTITHVWAHYPAERAGLLPGDQILKVDGEALECVEELGMAIRWKGAGNKLHLTISRQGRIKQLSALLDNRPKESAWAIEIPAKLGADRTGSIEDIQVYRTPDLLAAHLGLGLRPLNVDLAKELRCPSEKGLVVDEIRKGSTAEEVFRVGDVITKVDGRDVCCSDDLKKMLEDAESKTLIIEFYRLGKLMKLPVAIH